MVKLSLILLIGLCLTVLSTCAYAKDDITEELREEVQENEVVLNSDTPKEKRFNFDYKR